MTPLLTLDGVSVARGGQIVWSDGSFDVPRGSVVAVIGPNGSGKTTLLHLILGLLPPATGSVRVLGAAPRRGNPAIGYVPQHFNFTGSEYLRAYDQVMLGVSGTRWGIRGPKGRDHAAVASALADVGAGDLANRRISRLSGGQQQRVAIAQAVVGNPELLALDEPLASLDMRNQNELVSLLGRIRDRRDVGMLIVTHDLNPLLSILTGVIYLFDGHAHYGSVDEAISEDLLTHLYGTKIRVVRTAQGDLFTRSG